MSGSSSTNLTRVSLIVTRVSLIASPLLAGRRPANEQPNARRVERSAGATAFLSYLDWEGSMSLELLEARETAEGVAVTFATDRGLERLVGSADELAYLARAMQQVAALGALGENERVWIDEVPVGDAVVKLGLNPGGEARVLILRP
jgi:hypothetical protein